LSQFKTNIVKRELLKENPIWINEGLSWMNQNNAKIVTGRIFFKLIAFFISLKLLNHNETKRLILELFFEFEIVPLFYWNILTNFLLAWFSIHLFVYLLSRNRSWVYFGVSYLNMHFLSSSILSTRSFISFSLILSF
jgi:hypothetical protein